MRAESAAEPDEDEAWERVALQLTPESRAKVDEAMALAGKHLGATAPKWQRLEVMCQEFLGAHPVEPSADDERRGCSWSAPVEEWVEAARAGLEQEYDRWSFLTEVAPVEAEVSAALAAGAADPARLDEELRRLAAMRDGWDELVGHLGMLLQLLGLWRDMKFQSFAHYAAERLGMAARTVEQRAALERRLYALPALRGALRARRISYEQARVIAERADDTTVGEWISRAEGMTCLALRREADALGEAQMCTRGELDLRVPRRVASLLRDAMRAARAASDRWLTPAECLERIAEHCIETWRDELRERNTPRNRVMARDRGLCQVPGCSRAADDVHHLVYRSRGGGDEDANQAALCKPHHLRAIHGGYLRVSGSAPDRLTWRLVRADE